MSLSLGWRSPDPGLFLHLLALGEELGDELQYSRLQVLVGPGVLGRYLSPADLVWLFPEIDPWTLMLPGDLQQRGQYAQGGGLSRSVRTGKTEDLPPPS